MAITISGSGITSANIADGTIVNADVADVAASKLTGALPAIDGSALTGVGKVLQVVTDKIASTFSTSSQNVFVTTGQSLAITPSLASSKILIMFSAKSVTTVAANTAIEIEVRRSGTTVAQGGYYTATVGGTQTVPFGAIHTLDSPSTTSAITYEVFASEAGVPGTVSLNGPREITLMEIGA